MPDLKAILDDCFAEFSQEYEIERVTYVSQSGKNTEVDVPVWRLVIQAEYHGKVTDVELFLAFPHGFPYEMSRVFKDLGIYLIYHQVTVRYASMRMD